MMDLFTQVRWSPYVAGISIGILSWLTFLISKRPIACSTTFAKLSGMIEMLFRGDEVEQKPYYQKLRLIVGWQMMLVLGVVIGSLFSALLSGDFRGSGCLQPGKPHLAVRPCCELAWRCWAVLSSVSVPAGPVDVPAGMASAAHCNLLFRAGSLLFAFSSAGS